MNPTQTSYDPDTYYNPDRFYEYADSITFAYDNKTGELVTATGWNNHGELVDDNRDILSPEDYSRRGTKNGVLWGRLGVLHSRNLIVLSFWNPEPRTDPVYKDLGKIAQKFQKDIDRIKQFEREHSGAEMEVVFSLPHDGTFSVSDVTKQSRENSLTNSEILELLRRYHTAVGQEKVRIKRILMQYGYFGGFGSERTHPVYKAMRDKNMIVPGAKWWSPQSESFEKMVVRLTEAGYTDPDYFYGKNSTGVTFIYVTEKKELHTAPGNKTHSELQDAYIDEHGEGILPNYDDDGVPITYWKKLDIAIFGRMGIRVDGWEGAEPNPRIIIAVWNSQDINNPVFRNLGDMTVKLRRFADKMETDYNHDYPDFQSEYVKIPVLFSSPATGVVPVEDVLKGGYGGRRVKTPEEVRAELAAHNARGPEKKELLAKMGVGFDPSHDPHPWRTAVRKTGYTYPPFGEGEFESMVNSILE